MLQSYPVRLAKLRNVLQSVHLLFLSSPQPCVHSFNVHIVPNNRAVRIPLTPRYSRHMPAPLPSWPGCAGCWTRMLPTSERWLRWRTATRWLRHPAAPAIARCHRLECRQSNRSSLHSLGHSCMSQRSNPDSCKDVKMQDIQETSNAAIQIP